MDFSVAILDALSAGGIHARNCSRIVTVCPFPFPRFVNHSVIALANFPASTCSPVSSSPSPVGNVSSNSAEPVKFLMQKLSSHSNGTARLSPPISISAFSLCAYIFKSITLASLGGFFVPRQSLIPVFCNEFPLSILNFLITNLCRAIPRCPLSDTRFFIFGHLAPARINPFSRKSSVCYTL
jgi:hypothetical protein